MPIMTLYWSISAIIAFTSNIREKLYDNGQIDINVRFDFWW